MQELDNQEKIVVKHKLERGEEIPIEIEYGDDHLDEDGWLVGMDAETITFIGEYADKIVIDKEIIEFLWIAL